MRSISYLLAALLVVGAMAVSSTTTVAAAETAPQATRQVAKQLKCKRLVPMQIGAGPDASAGILCTAKVKPGVRQVFHVLDYPDVQAAVAYWRGQTAGYEQYRPGCVTRKGSIIVLSYGEPGYRGKPYTKRWCRYAAKRTGGRVIFGYPYAPQSAS